MLTPGKTKRLAIIGGGPAGLFMFKRLTETSFRNLTVDIFEARGQLGYGMPYGPAGANREHITNVSGNEIPELVTPVMEWIRSLPDERLNVYGIDRESFTEFMVFPRLLFGEYLNAQFELLKEKAARLKIPVRIYLNTRVSDIRDAPASNSVTVEVNEKDYLTYDQVIICTGHVWPKLHEDETPGYFDSPYPPSKLELKLNHPVAVRGSSLTAIDAIRTMARCNGSFLEEAPHKLKYVAAETSPDFRIVMHSRQGLLPGIRFHLDDPHLSKSSLLTKDEITAHIIANGGFLSLDYIFDKDFKETFREKDPSFYALVKNLKLEEFVDTMMGMREHTDPFLLFRYEYSEAEKSIRKKESVYWKEMLAVLSFAMNYPAKHFSAEDMLRLQKVLMPLISIVIAFVPQSSCEELLALHDAGRLELISVGEDSKVEILADKGIIYHRTNNEGEPVETNFKTFVDSIGQRHLSLEDFPFTSLVSGGSLRPARLPFRDGEAARAVQSGGNKDVEKDSDGKFFLKVPGVAIDDSFRVVQADGAANPRIYMMAVSYIGGYNPDYSGLDFCEEASGVVVDALFKE